VQDMLDIVDMEGKREPSKTSELKVGWGILKESVYRMIPQ